MIRASFDSRCPSCLEDIHEGDEIGMIDGEWCCAECVEDNGGEDPLE